MASDNPASDNPAVEHPSRTSTVQSFDIKTHWQGPCRGCHHHHHPRVVNIHVSHERRLQHKDFHCENCQKLLFCLGTSRRRWSLLSLNTDPGDDGDQSRAPSLGRRACFDTPPDDRRNRSTRSIDRPSEHGEDRLSSHSSQASHRDRHTENSEDAAHRAALEEEGQERAAQFTSATGALPQDRRSHGFRGFARRLISRMQQPLQRIFKRTRRPLPPPAPPSEPPSPHDHSSTNSDGTQSQPATSDAESVSALDHDARRELPPAPVLSSDDQPPPPDVSNDQTHIGRDGGRPEDIAELEEISKIRDKKTASAKSQEIVCRCGPECDCRTRVHGHFRSGGPSEQSASVQPSSSRPSISDSNPERRSQDPREYRYVGEWIVDQHITERQPESQSTALARRQSVATDSSATTAAVSHDALELPEPPPRAPSPLIYPPQSYSFLHTTSQSVGSRSQLRLSTHNLAPGGLETVGEASSTSETSQNQQNAFGNGAGNRQPASQTNEGPINEGSGDGGVHPSEVADQTHRSSQPADSSERNFNPESPGIPHAKTF